MHELLPYIVVGVTSGSAYALVALGLVLTYKTSGIFNFAHGALATASAYVFYALHVEHGVPWPLAGAVSVLVVGIVFGYILERTAKGLERANLAARIVAMVGILLIIQSVCELIFGNQSLTVTPFLSVSEVNLFGVEVTYDKIIIVVLSIAAMLLLYGFFRWSRLGKSMRAVVDNPELLDLCGTSPVKVRRAAWIIGSLFATLSGPLLIEILGRVDAGTLTALVVSAFAAAALGSFSSLPLTYVGGLLIGVAGSVGDELVGSSQSPILDALPAATPFVILFVLMLVMPKSRLRLRSIVPRKPQPRWSAPRRVQITGTVLTVAFLATVPAWAGFHVGDWTTMLTFVILFLSLGLLVKTSGQVSLCHVTLAAIGVVTFAKLAGGAGIPWIPALLLTGLIAVPVGAIIAIPAIRLSGVFLALATLGFGLLVENVFYNTNVMFGTSGTGVTPPLPHLSWLSVGSTNGFYYVVLVVTVICAGVIVALVRSRLGRLLQGMGDSALALSTSGTNVNVLRVLVFSVSAYFAAIGGALYGMYLVAPTGLSFDPFVSATYLTLIVITAGIEPWYALIAAAGFVLVGAYWQPSGFAYYLQIFFGVFAVIFAIFPPGGAPPRIRSAIERLGGRRGSSAARQRQMTRVAVPWPRIPLDSNCELTVRGLSVRFGGLAAVTDVSLAAPVGRVTGLIGPNGAGKTTTLNACSGLVRSTGGQVVLDGADISRMSVPARARRGLGRTYQHIELWDSLTVAQNVALGSEARFAGASALRQFLGRRGDAARVAAAAWDAMRLCDLEEYADVPVASMSTGRRRLVEVARCLAGGYNILLLDEPSSGLDRYETEGFARILRRVIDERGVGVLLVDHDMRLVLDVCEYIYVLDFGQLIYEGTPEAVAASREVRDAYLGAVELDPQSTSPGDSNSTAAEVTQP
jgi:ABC-type branched-subunit amino acid transport system ATPase component/branched-subunit amino acid ABC-type transport system permease component